jgi:hypothetical protein
MRLITIFLIPEAKLAILIVAPSINVPKTIQGQDMRWTFINCHLDVHDPRTRVRLVLSEREGDQARFHSISDSSLGRPIRVFIVKQCPDTCSRVCCKAQATGPVFAPRGNPAVLHKGNYESIPEDSLVDLTTNFGRVESRMDMALPPFAPDPKIAHDGNCAHN